MRHRFTRVLFGALLWCGLMCAPQLAFADGAAVAAPEGDDVVELPSASEPGGELGEGVGTDGTVTEGAQPEAPLVDLVDEIDEPDGPVQEPTVEVESEQSAEPKTIIAPAEPDASSTAPAAAAPVPTPQAVDPAASATPAVKKAVAAKTASSEASEKKAPSISYRAHSQNIGWQNTVNSGEAGTTGKALRLEALRVTIDFGGYKGGLQMQARVQNAGWQAVLGNGKTMGTTGKSQSIQALRMILTGEVSMYYDIKYRAHVQNIGWQGWKANGALAGTANDPLRIEAVEIVLAEKKAPAAKETPGIVGIRYQAHVQNIGWQGVQANGYNAGTTGQSLRVEALRIWADLGTSLKGDVEYRVHVQNKGWMPWVKNGATAGTTGKSLRVEAVQIRLTGDLASTYDLTYTTHVQNVGWQYKRYNGKEAGTTGQSLRVEALNAKLVDKNSWTGWYGSGKSWQYVRKGTPAKGEWIVTEESPIATSPGLQRYWVDTSGKLAVSRFVEPGKARDRGSWSAYATGDGYVFRNGLSKIAGAWYYADNDGKLTKVGNIGSKISAYVNWAIRIANDDSHGYSQINRWGPDYDCSSLVIAALQYAGFQVGEAVYTGNMVSELTKYGFTYRTDLNNLRTGDILWVHNSSHQHTEIYVGGGQIVGASSSENGGIRGRVGDQTGREIRVRSYYNMPWAGYLRAS